MEKDIKTGKFICSLEKNLSIEQVKKVYAELNELKKTAIIFGVSSEGLRKYFIRNKIPYAKKIRYVCNDKLFDIDNETSFYWAGFLAADGNVSKENDISLALSKTDIEHVYKFKKDMQSDSPVTLHETKECELEGYIISGCAARFRIRSSYMAESLKRFNIVPAKTKIYTMPNFVGDSEYFKHYLRGYFDGDGWFSLIKNGKYSGRISLGLCGTKEFIEKINNLIIKNINVSSGSICKQKNIFKLNFSKQHDVYLISNFMYNNATIYLDRKYKKSLLTKEADEKTIILNLDKNKLKELYNHLKSYEKVAKKLNCSKSAVAKYINKYNIEKQC